MNETDIKELERGYTESKIQHICVQWFRQTFPTVGNLLFSVPNGNLRQTRTAVICKYEGQVNGVADLILLYPSQGKCSLCIEMKVPKRKVSSAGKQSDAQKQWQQLVTKYGSEYVVCHGLIEFITSVCSYLNLDTENHIINALNKYPLYR